MVAYDIQVSSFGYSWMHAKTLEYATDNNVVWVHILSAYICLSNNKKTMKKYRLFSQIFDSIFSCWRLTTLLKLTKLSISIIHYIL